MIFKIRTQDGNPVRLHRVNEYGQTVGYAAIEDGTCAAIMRELGPYDARVVATKRSFKIGEFLLNDGSVISGRMSKDWLGRWHHHIWEEA
jgi:hypothetical protein